MKKRIEKIIAITLSVIMLFGLAPLNGFVGLELPNLSELFITKANAEDNTSGIKVSGTGWTLFNDGELVISENLPNYKARYIDGTNCPLNTPWYNYIDSITKGTVLAGVTRLPDLLFGSCYNMKSVILPDTITEMGNAVFYNCQLLETIDAPTGILSAGTYVGNGRVNSEGIVQTYIIRGMFDNCQSLKSVQLSSNITEIGSLAFINCYSLENITIPEGVTSLGFWCFADCTSLKEIIVPDSVVTQTNARGIPFTGETGAQNRVGGCFTGCTSLERVVVGSGINTLYYSWNNVPGIATCPEIHARTGNHDPYGSVGYRCDGWFTGCTSLKSVEFKSNVIIDLYTFCNCINLESIKLDKATIIKDYAFGSCAKLKQISFSSDLIR